MSLKDQLSTKPNLTFKANIKEGRYGWLRLTPAYSLHLVQERVSRLEIGSCVIEPFSGSGTTALAAMNLGMHVYARDINPFLVWFAQVKTNTYSDEQIEECLDKGMVICDLSKKNRDANELWQPALHNIERWWSAPTLDALKVIMNKVESDTGSSKDLLSVAFCRTMITVSNAAFNHQSMSFKDKETPDEDYDNLYLSVINQFMEDVQFVCSSAKDNPIGSCEIVNDDSRKLFDESIRADYLITSPPYANRMSYIRELRPYMYWLKFLETPDEASNLDWETIGGTWGKASTKIKSWKPEEGYNTPIDDEIEPIVRKIIDGKSGKILAPYVHKYFADMWLHFKAVIPAMKEGAELCYIVGNSTFSGNEVPTQDWYAEMMGYAGLRDIKIETIRKRNSNKRLYEYAVSGKR